MSEIDLVDLGFKRFDVTVEESEGESFYYYVYELSKQNDRFLLVSNEHDNTINGKWWVTWTDTNEYIYKDRQQVSDIISSITGKGYGNRE